MYNSDQLLDNFEDNNKSNRWRLYFGYTCIVFILIWGVAYLHWKQYIDAIPIVASNFARLGLMLLLFVTLLIYRLVLRLSWLLSIFVGFVIFCLLCVLLAVGVFYLDLDAGSLPFKKELMRLSFFSSMYSLLSILPIEITYRLQEKNKK